MNQNVLTCPTQQQLMAFVAGKLNVTESAEIEQHLAECESCCQLLKMLPDEDTLVSLLRDPQAETANEGSQRPLSPQHAATLPPTGEQLTLPPSDGVTEIDGATENDAALSLPEPLRDHSRYRVMQLLGRGGMGDVYKAHHRMMNRPVALKVINAQLVNSHAAVQRFHREVQAAARLTHPNIVTAFDAEQAGDTHFLVMEYVDGVELADVIKDRGPLPVAEACDYVRQAALGLQHAHEQGMVHRDIKPQNLMLVSREPERVKSPEPEGAESRESRVESQNERDGGRLSGPRPSTLHSRPSDSRPSDSRPSIKILDFGLANLAGAAAEEVIQHESDLTTGSMLERHLTQLGSMMGTPDYMAPEQADDAHRADIRADIYSLGCTLYCLLTGKAPFSEGSVTDKVQAHLQHVARSLSEFRDDVPAELEAVIARMMNKSPAERFQTPIEVARALEPFLASHAASKPKRQSRRSIVVPLTIMATLLLGFFIASAAVIVVVTDQGRLRIQSEVDNVQVVVKQGDQEITTFDSKTGSQVKWLPTGTYEVELVGGDNDVKLDKTGFEMTRLGKVIVTARWNSEDSGAIRSFTPDDPTITRDNVEVAEGGWKITANDTQTAKLFEVADPNLEVGLFFYRAKLKTENVKGRAYLEMWVRFPGKGEFFSKGFHNALTGTNGWAEYEIPFLLEKGQQPDLVKLNLTIEGGGTVWIKDIELRRSKPTAGNADATVSDEKRLQGKWIAVSGHARKKPLTAAELAQLSITFDGERVEFVQPSGPPTPIAATFTINSNRDPKQIDFVAPGKQESMPGIYQFDGDRLKLALIDQDYSRPTNFDPDHRPDHLTAVFERVTVAATLGDEERDVLKAAEAFLAMLDEDNRDQLYEMSSTLAKSAATKEQASKHYQLVRETVGNATQRTLQRLWLIDEFPGLPAGRYACVEYKTKFANRTGLMFESAVLNIDPDGRWRVNTYAATLERLPIPGPKTRPEPAAVAKTPAAQSGLVQAGVNLITDSSLENTPAGMLPTGWSAWLDDGPDFKCAIVEGGVTGKHCLQIAGKGTRGVVFCNSLPLDRTKRYALKGRIKCEGDATARAVVKFNYFYAGKWLGVNDLVGVAGNQTGWQLFEKTDVADTIPDATLLVPTCHIEGNGNAWFDDLELIAYDRDKLPADFDTKHGKNNRLTADLDFDRWVGRWESTTVYKPTTSTPDETTVKGEVVIRKVLDDRFLFWQWASEAGDQQYASLLGLDPYAGGYHIWLFGSGGEVYERIGQWDTASQSLSMQSKPPSPGVTGVSTDRFVSNDRIESTLLVKSADGQVTRDMRATWVRKSAAVPEEIALANSPAAGIEELAILQKMAGNWTIRQTNKPSVWFPDVETSTATEHTAWTIGGRFMLFRSYDDTQNMKTLAFMTYEPAENSYRIWHFANDVFGGQWRITWDSSSRGFHWRAIDMPTGWIGTGFNRWVDDDTFDNQALIKDENGRVLLDSQQEKKRIK